VKIIVCLIKVTVLMEEGAILHVGIQIIELFSENKSDFTKLTDIVGLSAI
jgi:hypothetical protein